MIQNQKFQLGYIVSFIRLTDNLFLKLAFPGFPWIAISFVINNKSCIIIVEVLFLSMELKRLYFNTLNCYIYLR